MRAYSAPTSSDPAMPSDPPAPSGLRRARRVGGALALIVAATALVPGAAPAAVLPPAPTVAPTILSGPSALTTATGATFRYAHPQVGVTFECSLDGRAYASCASTGASYTGLAQGAHTFRVAARNGTSDLGPAATAAWTIDRTAPTVAVTGPSGVAAFHAGTWATACGAEPGVCGTAADGAGVSLVRVAVADAGARWWNGTAFAATTATYVNATGTTSWRLPLALPPDGTYTVTVLARDALGNQTAASAPVTASLVVDTAVPGAPELTSVPAAALTPETAATAALSFRLPPGVTGVTATCSLDGAPGGPCTSPFAVASTAAALGHHCATVQAVGRAGLVGPEATACWHVVADRGFTATGEVQGVLVPGVARLVDLRLTNPYPVTLHVLTVTIAVAADTDRPGCSGPANLVPTRELVGPVDVPAGETRSLSELGVPTWRWPVVSMPNLDTNQDACKGARFTLAYSGTAST